MTKHVASVAIAEDGKSWNAMCTHRVRIEDEKVINASIFKLIKQAYEQAG